MLLDLATSGDGAHTVGLRSVVPGVDTRAAEDTVDGCGRTIDDVMVSLVHRLELDGFSPSVKGSKITLARCPFAELAAVDAEVVRALLGRFARRNHRTGPAAR